MPIPPQLFLLSNPGQQQIFALGAVGSVGVSMHQGPHGGGPVIAIADLGE
jgi:hypothetical protein